MQTSLELINKCLNNSALFDKYKTINSIAEFKSHYKINTYEFFSVPIQQQFNLGQGFIKDDVIYWALTSGTTSGPKYVPITQSFLSEYLHCVKPLFDNILKEFGTDFLVAKSLLPLIGKYHYKYSPLGSVVGCMSGLIFKLSEEKYKDFLTYNISHSEELSYEDRWEYVCNSAKHKTIRCIITTNPGLLIELIRRNSKNGNVNSIDANLLWPELKLIICQTGSSSGTYINILYELFPNVKIWDGGIGGSEGYYATTQFTDQPIGKLNDDKYYFEFLPSTNKKEEKTYEFTQLKEGELYEMIITTSNGFIRYNTEDLVERKGDLIKYIGRKNKVYSFAGERLSEVQLNDAFGLLAIQLKLDRISFKFSWKNKKYTFYILESVPLAIDDISVNIDDILQNININYFYARKLYKAIEKPNVKKISLLEFSNLDIYEPNGKIKLLRQEKPTLLVK